MFKAMASWNQLQHRDMANSKRQIRPNVRLGEIGDLPAALLTALYFSRQQEFEYSDEDVPHTDSTPTSDGPAASEAPFSTAILATNRPFVQAGSGNFHLHNAATNIHPKRTHSVSSQYALRFSSKSGTEENPPLDSKTSTAKGSNGKRGRDSFKGQPALEEPTRFVPPVIDIEDNERENASPARNSMNTLLDQPYNASSPIGLETSEGSQGANKTIAQHANETTDSRETMLLETSMMNSGSVGSQEGTRSRLVISKDPSVQDKYGREYIGETRGYRANDQENSMFGVKYELCQSKRPRQTNFIPTGTALLETIGRVDSREPRNRGKEQQPGRSVLHVNLANGVRGWLQNLGLGKYAPLFEIHEVDTEVLPFLTLEDLKEMEIRAVGTRRKLFSAIQHLGKGVMT